MLNLRTSLEISFMYVQGRHNSQFLLKINNLPFLLVDLFQYYF